MNELLEELKVKLDETERAEALAFERCTKAKAEWYIAEESVSLSEHDGEDLNKAKAVAYDARRELAAASRAWQEAHELYQDASMTLSSIEIEWDEQWRPVIVDDAPTEEQMAAARLLFVDD